MYARKDSERYLGHAHNGLGKSHRADFQRFPGYFVRISEARRYGQSGSVALFFALLLRQNFTFIKSRGFGAIPLKMEHS
jgi:hypothetical protein